jgi:hypothetical protein
MTADNLDGKRCDARTKGGAPCRATPTGSGLCFAHDPALSDKRQQARRRGGSNSAHRVRFSSAMSPLLADVLDFIITAMRDVTGGGLDHRRAQAVAALAGAAVRTYESGSLEQRLRDLEEGDDDAH